MAMEIIDVKYRDMFGINPKYERIIENKLNDADCYHAFQVLVNTALKNLILEIEGKTPIRLIEPRMFGAYYEYNNDPHSYCRDVFEGYAPHPCSAKQFNQKVGNIYAPARLTKYVNNGLMKRGKYGGKSETYCYYLPYDFFTTNNPEIKFVPNDWERESIKLTSNDF
jgi:hypothetical protein